MGQDNIPEPDAPGFEALQISPQAIENILPQMLHGEGFSARRGQLIWFDRLLGYATRDLSLPKRPKEQSWSHNHPESGECWLKALQDECRPRGTGPPSRLDVRLSRLSIRGRTYCPKASANRHKGSPR